MQVSLGLRLLQNLATRPNVNLRKSINEKILIKILYSRANHHNWNVLHKTIYHIIRINELCSTYQNLLPILQKLDSTITSELYSLQEIMCRTLDFSQLNKKHRPLIKFGLDSELDARKLKRKDIAKNITVAADFMVNQLPDFINECSVVYLPEMGHLTAVKEWAPNCDRNDLQNAGCQFVFEIRGNLYFKNSLCRELDKHLGDIQQEILAHETRILQRLSEYVLQHNKSIRESLQKVAIIDCLISMSKVAKEGNYIRPKLNTDNTQEIINGRHPLFEPHVSNFVPNSYTSGRDNRRIKILTGPNASGKSVYLKQIAVLTYLAHIGSYIPANKANISIVSSIYSRISATETATIPLSAFMIDSIQMSQTLQNTEHSSLLLIDEFGRGTMAKDGICLLVAALRSFAERKERCPHIIVSTHYRNLFQYLPRSPLISCYKMGHLIDGTQVVFLYRVVEGISTSFAFDVAAAAGLSRDFVARAKEIFDAQTNSQHITPLPQLTHPSFSDPNLSDKKCRQEFLENIDIPDIEDK